MDVDPPAVDEPNGLPVGPGQVRPTQATAASVPPATSASSTITAATAAFRRRRARRSASARWPRCAAPSALPVEASMATMAFASVRPAANVVDPAFPATRSVGLRDASITGPPTGGVAGSAVAASVVVPPPDNSVGVVGTIVVGRSSPTNGDSTATAEATAMPVLNSARTSAGGSGASSRRSWTAAVDTSLLSSIASRSIASRALVAFTRSADRASAASPTSAARRRSRSGLVARSRRSGAAARC